MRTQESQQGEEGSRSAVPLRGNMESAVHPDMGDRRALSPTLECDVWNVCSMECRRGDGGVGCHKRHARCPNVFWYFLFRWGVLMQHGLLFYIEKL